MNQPGSFKRPGFARSLCIRMVVRHRVIADLLTNVFGATAVATFIAQMAPVPVRRDPLL